MLSLDLSNILLIFADVNLYTNTNTQSNDMLCSELSLRYLILVHLRVLMRSFADFILLHLLHELKPQKPHIATNNIIKYRLRRYSNK